MKELKILAIVIFFTALTYWGVEPFAHSQMHPHIEPANFTYSDLEKITNDEDILVGKTLVEENCIACHSISILEVTAPMSESDSEEAYGVVPPDLSNAGVIYDKTYLSNFLKDPIKATQLSHKFSDSKPYGMPSFEWLTAKERESIVAYLKSISTKKISDKIVFEEACGRCHSMKYDNLKALTSIQAVQKYLGTQAPDLSMMIRSKKAEYLAVFINEPLKMVEGIAMPRVGLTKDSQEQVINYMEKVGDRKKDERESLGLKLMAFMTVFSIIAYLWKVKIWKEVQ